MNLYIMLGIALRSLAKNKLRTLLTMLGIIIGVGSVIAMLAVGQGARQSIESTIASMGTNVISIHQAGGHGPGSVRTEAGASSQFTIEDVDAIRSEVSTVSYATPVVNTSAQVKYGALNWRTRIYGVLPEYLLIRKLELQSGTPFYISDHRGANKVCLVGKSVVDELFVGGEDPIGKMIRIRNMPFKILGVLESKGQGSFGQDQDDVIIAPFNTVQRKILGESNVQSMMVSASTKDVIDETVTKIEELLRHRKRVPDGEESDFQIRTQMELSEAASSTSKALTMLLSSIAGISLLVGGIGIMNIMLVSVTERTREIGIRMAVGARGKDIMRQFLVESIVMSFLGGCIGVLLGVGISTILANVQGWAVQVSIQSILLAFIFSTMIGVFFGWYPARKAAKLSPIDALRYE